MALQTGLQRARLPTQLRQLAAHVLVIILRLLQVQRQTVQLLRCNFCPQLLQAQATGMAQQFFAITFTALTLGLLGREAAHYLCQQRHVGHTGSSVKRLQARLQL